ncbi:2-aminoadipate transaminase [Sugiyamaella lignohabitans]|uniref:2-aminoadipate transaminase n=1 Tax=Sugiyamaella lignohabitans TaxID=796027 RepID=A0A167EVJ6_9ASCO|nr:2-aminoadipate transaminase [Sugiyamaella lignohabitans]ANB14513.1 2-aminoadipate transaminase [Sugiyamaella lignohabitans]
MSVSKVKKVNFFRGHPSNSLLGPSSHYVLKASENVLSPAHRPGDDDDEDRHPLTYGSDPGSLTVRKQIAKWTYPDLSADKEQIYADSINLTNGASFGAGGALLQCTSAHSGFTKQAFIVSPTYFLINSVFLDAGFADKFSPIEQRADGSIDLVALEKLLVHFDKEPEVSYEDAAKYIQDDSRPRRKLYKYVMYLVPTFSNPRGTVIPLSDRLKLLELARAHDMLLLCDDVYDWLYYKADSINDLPPRLVTLDRESTTDSSSYGNTISNCTFSKLVGPGLRVGWQETVSPRLAQQLCQGGAVRSGGTPAHLNTMLVGSLLSLGYMESILKDLRSVFGDRSKHMRQDFEKYLPQGTQIEGGEGGYFFWVTLPEEYNGRAIAEQCLKKNVVLAEAHNFQVAHGPTPRVPINDNSFRICFAYHTVEESQQGIQVWGEVCEENKNK